MICRHCKTDNAPIKKTCANCGKILSGPTINNVTGKYGIRHDDGSFTPFNKNKNNYKMNKKPDMKGWELQGIIRETESISLAWFAREYEEVKLLIDTWKSGTMKEQKASIEEWAAPLLPPESRNESLFDSMSKPIQTGTVKSIAGDKTFDLRDAFVQSEDFPRVGITNTPRDEYKSKVPKNNKMKLSPEIKKAIRKEARKNMPFTDEEIEILKNLITRESSKRIAIEKYLTPEGTILL